MKHGPRTLDEIAKDIVKRVNLHVPKDCQISEKDYYLGRPLMEMLKFNLGMAMEEHAGQEIARLIRAATDLERE